MEELVKDILVSFMGCLLLVITLANLFDGSGLFSAKKVSCKVTKVEVLSETTNYTFTYKNKKTVKQFFHSDLSVGDKYTLYKAVNGNGTDWDLFTKSELVEQRHIFIIRCSLLLFASLIVFVCALKKE